MKEPNHTMLKKVPHGNKSYWMKLVLQSCFEKPTKMRLTKVTTDASIDMFDTDTLEDAKGNYLPAFISFQALRQRP